jgi:hypothetical protein
VGSGWPGDRIQALPAQRPDPHRHARLGCLDHAGVVDGDGDVVDRGGVVRVVGVEQQVPLDRSAWRAGRDRGGGATATGRRRSAAPTRGPRAARPARPARSSRRRRGLRHPARRACPAGRARTRPPAPPPVSVALRFPLRSAAVVRSAVRIVLTIVLRMAVRMAVRPAGVAPRRHAVAPPGAAGPPCWARRWPQVGGRLGRRRPGRPGAGPPAARRSPTPVPAATGRRAGGGGAS